MGRGVGGHHALQFGRLSFFESSAIVSDPQLHFGLNCVKQTKIILQYIHTYIYITHILLNRNPVIIRTYLFIITNILLNRNPVIIRTYLYITNILLNKNPVMIRTYLYLHITNILLNKNSFMIRTYLYITNILLNKIILHSRLLNQEMNQ